MSQAVKTKVKVGDVLRLPSRSDTWGLPFVVRQNTVSLSLGIVMRMTKTMAMVKCGVYGQEIRVRLSDGQLIGTNKGIREYAVPATKDDIQRHEQSARLIKAWREIENFPGVVKSLKRDEQLDKQVIFQIAELMVSAIKKEAA